MARAAAAAARSAPARGAPARRRVAPGRRPSRRASGRTAPRRGQAALASAGLAARLARGLVRRPRQEAPAPLGARVLDAVLSGRIWIGLIGVLLAGIVFFNVDLMQMNREITQMADRAAELKRKNARIRLDVARLANSERIQQAAAELGLVLPAPGEVRYLRSNPAIDARTASKRIIAPTTTFAVPQAQETISSSSTVTTGTTSATGTGTEATAAGTTATDATTTTTPSTTTPTTPTTPYTPPTTTTTPPTTTSPTTTTTQSPTG